MVLQSSGAISFSNIQTEFGGANPISLSEYYSNSGTGYTSGISGIPNTGSSISLSQFLGKSKTIVNYMVSGTGLGYMEEYGSSRIASLTGQDDSAASIGNNNFSFYFFGTDYNNNMFWSSNQVLTFGAANAAIGFTSTTGKGILLGNYDRRCNFITPIPTVTVNGYSIYKLVINHANYYGTPGSEIQMVIRIIRGPTDQYIEVRMASWTAANAGLWNITDGTTFKDTFGAYVPGDGQSFVLKSDLSGNNWTFFNYNYINLLEKLVYGNVRGSMVEPVGTTTINGLTQVDAGLGFLGDIGFSFYFFGTDYRTNINWSSNHVLQFGNLGSGNINIWSSNSGKAILLGNFDRNCNIAKACPTTTSNGYYIKRLLIDSDNSWSGDSNDIKMELRLIRGSTEQYIEVRMAYWAAANAGTWNITDGTTFKDTFGSYVPGDGQSFVLQSDLLGNNWTFFNYYYINL